jgi:hypothetical protein
MSIALFDTAITGDNNLSVDDVHINCPNCSVKLDREQFGLAGLFGT